MSAQQRQTRVIADLRGRDGSTTADIAVPKTRSREHVNTDFYQTPFARKRNGSVNAFAETTSEAFTGILSTLIRHVPGADETAAELWGVDSAATPVVQRLAGGTAWASPTLKDNIATRPQDVIGVSFNGKLYLFYDSAVDRGHVWDGSTVRRTGLATPAAATVADTGAGTYAATLRYYKIIYVAAGPRWSEASASVSFTPSGTGTHARITKPAAISEGETHWRIYVSVDDVVYFFLVEVVVGTTFYDDDADPADPSSSLVIPLIGENTVPVSAKYGLVDDNRLLMAGSWETTTFESRVWFTPRQGDSGIGDDERIPDTVDRENWIDLDEKDGGAITGLQGPIQGMPVVFKYRQLWKLRPTGEVTAPYQPLAISKVVGCIRQQLSVMAEDENGDPCLYWWDVTGPYRLGTQGVQYCGRDLEDYTAPGADGTAARINLEATTVVGFAVYHKDRHQIWWWLAIDDENTPTLIFVFDVRLGEADEDDNVRDGWSIFDGPIADARCATMFATTLGASMSRDLKPYIGIDTAATLYRGDEGSTDNGTTFAGYVRLPEQHLAGLTTKCDVHQAIVLGNAGPHDLQLDLSRDYGAETRIFNVAMSPETGDQTRSQKAWEDAAMADAKSIGMRVGDICPIGAQWQIDAVVIQYEAKEGIAP